MGCFLLSVSLNSLAWLLLLMLYRYQRHLLSRYLTTYINLQSLGVHSKNMRIFSVMYFYNTIREYFMNNKRTIPSRFQLTWEQPQSICIEKYSSLFEILFSPGDCYDTFWFSLCRSQHSHRLSVAFLLTHLTSTIFSF